MTFPLSTLFSRASGSKNSEEGHQPPESTRATAADSQRAPSLGPVPLRVSVYFIAWLLALLAMLTHHAQDAAFTTTGTQGTPRNWVGIMGAWGSDLLLFLFGLSAWWIIAVSLSTWLAALALRVRWGALTAPPPKSPPNWRRIVGLIILLCASCALEWTRLYQSEAYIPGHAGGILGYSLGQWSVKWLGFEGSGVTWIALLVIGTAWAFHFSWLHWAEQLGGWVENWRTQRQAQRARAKDKIIGEQAKQEREVDLRLEDVAPITEHTIPPPTPPLVVTPVPADVVKSERVIKERQQTLFSDDHQEGTLPRVDLLDAAPLRQESVATETLEMTSRLIEKKLRDFGVEVQVVAASPGPVITRYEIEPATGVKGSQVVNLAKDLARSLSLVSIRVVETIPGKTTMALELPNAKRQTIKLSEILGSQLYHQSHSLLTMGLGKDIVGQAVVADLAKMPHCLVAGTTGSGKSVGINAMILSLLYKAEARDVRLILIDPKMLEMSVYEGIAHLLCPVVTDMKQAANALNWCVGEMERRYKLMSKMGVRNLAGYNKKIDDTQARGECIANPFSLTPEEPEPLDRLPFIVVVIDELADLMMVVGKKIEELIARLAQKARACGIHLILATQRPSVDVITGLIKANIPTRISFQVSSKIDSRTILDQMGAEALLGMGDMLYMASGTGFPTRVHGAFVSDDEVHRVVEYIKSKGEPNYIEGILEGGTVEDNSSDGLLDESSSGESDPLYDKAVAIVVQNKRASISLVQRHLGIGYNRSAKLLEQMEKSGVVSAMSSSGKRDIIAPRHAD